MKISILTFLFLTITLYSCGSINAQKETLKNQEKIIDCIQEKINTFKSQPVSDPPMAIYQYTYNNNTVYFIVPPCCDRYSTLYDSNCNIVCHPDGGFTAKGDGKCRDFFDKRTNEKLIWKDNRKSK